jgi:Chaperone for flagella basal body P-ring formation
MRTTSFPRLCVVFAALAFSAPAGAETSVNVEGPSVRLSDIDPSAPAELADLELARTPPPGGSRVLTAREIRERLIEAGADPKRVRVPASIRVEAPAERWRAAEVAVRAEPIVRGALPDGVSLVKISASQGVVVPPGTTVAAAHPVIPHGVGRHDVTVVAELRREGLVVARAPLSLVVDVGEDAFAPILRKGDRLTLIVEQGNARIGASAVALADANAGDSIWCRVTSTGKTLKARVANRDTGMVVDL